MVFWKLASFICPNWTTRCQKVENWRTLFLSLGREFDKKFLNMTSRCTSSPVGNIRILDFHHFPLSLSCWKLCMTLFYNRFLTTYHIIWCCWNLPLQYLDNNRNCSHQNSLPLQILKNCSNEWIFYHSNADILQYSHNWKQHCDPHYIERIWGQSILQFSYGPTCWAIGIS